MAFASASTAPPFALRRSVVHSLSLYAVFFTFAASSIVFREPAPVDAMMVGLAVLLPAVGLVAMRRLVVWYMVLWLVPAACSALASVFAFDFASSAEFVAVSIYLSMASVVIAAFVARTPLEHTMLILNGYLVAAIIAAATGVIGYFNLLPGGADLFTKFGRVAGTFKDPNVYGTFLILPAVYMLHRALAQPIGRAVLPLAVSAFLAFGVLLSFSRGAWMALAIAVAGYGYLVFVTSRSAAHRMKIVWLAGVGLVLAATTLVAALQIDSISKLLKERASLEQSYDVGPEGRFGGQEKAVALALEHPLGIGALEFRRYHSEEPHNVYLSMLLNAGWLGGGGYALLVVVTLLLGAYYVLVPSPVQPLLQVTYVCFLAIALEGFLIDSDHWRHFYLLLALIWGLMAAHHRQRT